MAILGESKWLVAFILHCKQILEMVIDRDDLEIAEAAKQAEK